MSDTLEIPLKELKDWLKKETAPKIEPIRTEGKARLNDLKTKMAELQESCEKLLEDSEKEMLKSNPKTYRRARAAYKFARDVLQAIDQQEAPNSITYESLKDFCEEWGRMFTEIGEERARKFRRISPYFILDRRSFDGTLKKSVESFRELRDFLSQGYEEAKAIEGSFRAFDNLDLALKELEKIGKRKKRAESKRKSVEERIDDIRRKMSSLRNKGKVNELRKVADEIRRLENKLERDLRHLEKPFLKFQKLIQGPKYRLPPTEAKKLNQYMRIPFQALATEKKGYPQLRRILQQMEDAMKKGKLKLKRSRLEKAKEKIDEILNQNSLIPLHENCRKAYSKRRHLQTTETVTVSRRKRGKLEERLRNLNKRKKLADSRLAVLERRYDAELEDIQKQKEELENTIVEITNKSIEITL